MVGFEWITQKSYLVQYSLRKSKSEIEMNCTVIMKLTILAFSFVLFTFYEILLRVVKVQEEADEPVNSLDSGRRVIRSLGRQSARSGDKAHARDLQCQRSGGGEALDREEKGSVGIQSSRSGRVVPAVGRRRAQGATRSGDNALRR